MTTVQGKINTITYREYVFMALGIQHAMRMRHFFICGLPGSTTFLHCISQKAWFSKKKLNTKVCFDFLYAFFNTYHSQKN